jgi:processive 1,2-diacylglycerol beta-glucosyltransferase
MNILILSASFGHGHAAAAQGVYEHLSLKMGQTARIEIIDFMEFCNKFINQAIKKSYFTSIKFIPQVYQSLFKGTDKKWQAKLINILSYPFIYKKIQELVAAKTPDLIISTYPVWNYSIRKIWGKIKPNPRLITVITDSTVIHHTWVLEDHSDAYIVTDPQTKTAVEELGINPKKIYPLGFPLRQDFFQKYAKPDLIQKFKLDSQKFTLLYLLNNNASLREYNILKTLNKLTPDWQLIIVIGENKSFAQKLKKIHFNFPIQIINWTDQMAMLMQTADLIVTKAGGSTTAECIQSGIPVLFSQILPQEQGNAAYVIQAQMGDILKGLKVEKAAQKIVKLASFKNINFQQMRKAAKKHQFSNQTSKIAELVRRMKSN